MSSDAYRAHLTLRRTEAGLPVTLHAGLREYIAARRPVGGFLTAVLSNDLAEACKRADEDNRTRICDVLVFLHAYAPAPCWGSPDKVHAWLLDQTPVPEVYE